MNREFVIVFHSKMFALRLKSELKKVTIVSVRKNKNNDYDLKYSYNNDNVIITHCIIKEFFKSNFENIRSKEYHSYHEAKCFYDTISSNVKFILPYYYNINTVIWRQYE